MRIRRFVFRLMIAAAPLTFSGCGAFDSLDDWANANMPVIGQRCEHWQCFTESGQAESDANRAARLRAEAGLPPAGSRPPAPAMAAEPMRQPIAENPASAYPAQQPPQQQQQQTRYTPPDPMAPGMPPVPTTVYVPRGKPAPGTTPYDGNIPPD